MPTAYLVMGRYFYWTDEYFAPADGEGSQPVTDDPRRVFYDQQEAEEYAAHLNAQVFDGFIPGQYALDLSEITSLGEQELVPRLNAILGPENALPIEQQWMDLELPSGLTEDQLQQIAELFRLRLYRVVGAEVADTAPLEVFNAASQDGDQPPAHQAWDSVIEPLPDEIPEDLADEYADPDPERTAREKKIAEMFGVHYVAFEERI